jgi:PAS domain S-box-containing protein
MVLITFAILWVAMALHRADQNRTAAETGLKELVQLAAFSAEVNITVARPEALLKRFQHCSDSMVRDLDAALVEIWTLDESANMLDRVAGSGLDTYPGGLNRRVPVGQLAIGQIARDRAPHLTDDVQNDPLVGDQEWARCEGMVAFAGHPLLVGDRLVGVMTLFSRQPLTAATLETIKTVANSIALGIARDQSEIALRQTHARLGALMQDSPLAIICLDQASHVTVWNPAAERILGWTESEVLGRRMPVNVSPAPDAPLPGRDRGIATSGSTPLETRCRRRDGTELDVQIVATTLQTSGGEQAGTLLFLADISEKLRADAQYRQSLKMDALGRLAGGVAHDFNNLLTAIMGYGELVKNSLAPDAPARRDAEEILNAAGRGAALTRQLLDFSRNQPLEYTTLCLNESIDGIGTMLRHFIGEAITLVTAPGAVCPHIRADAGEVEQVLLNLVINARDAMPEGGTITIETADVVFDHDPAAVRSSGPSGPHVMLAVSDTGVGISREVQARLFDPFFTTKDFGKGTGLGLSTVHGVITRCGGFVEVVSQLGIGTTFKLFFPRTTEPLSAVSQPESTGASQTAGGTVLLVEDEQPLRRVIHQSLRHSGYTVLEAAGPEAAIAICEHPEQVIDLLLTDVVMPVMTGPELARRVASLRPELPVLFISGYAESALAPKRGAGRKASFLQKPFTPEELAHTIREILELPLQRTA